MQHSMKIGEQVAETLHVCDRNEGTHRGGGGRDDTCDHGLSRRSLRVKPLTSQAGKKVQVMIEGKKNKHKSTALFLGV